VQRVVIIDDDRGMRLLARVTAEDGGARVVGEAAAAADGLALVERLRPTLVLMDYRLPDHDGVWATARITASCPDVEVVAWTSTDDPAIAGAFRAAGATEVIFKRELDRLRGLFELARS
jgi:DNA-binding NarL/FixJ family response regulator